MEKFCAYSALIRLVLESYLEISVSTFLNVLQLKWEGVGNITSSLVSIFFLFVITFGPIGFFFMLSLQISMQVENKEEPTFKRKF